VCAARPGGRAAAPRGVQCSILATSVEVDGYCNNNRQLVAIRFLACV
jgi:hypothetical protein